MNRVDAEENISAAAVPKRARRPGLRRVPAGRLDVFAASFTNLLNAVFEKPVYVVLKLLELVGQKPLQLPAEIGCRFQLEFQVEARLDTAEQLLSGRLTGVS